ncbi:MAG: hypothetical protein HY951_04055 [Bacteroidia bacterium]|nr:hypothetical protein [Bacteroidia bacterium]
MKTIITFITCLSIPMIVFSQQLKFEKKLQNSFNSNVNTVLHINNSYGNITFHNWEKKEISVDITITLFTENEAEAQKYIENADVVLMQDSDKIQYTTTIKYENLDKSFKKSKSKFQVDYVINHPVYLQINIENSYGNINIDEISGNSNINLNYGKFTAKNLAFYDAKPVSNININYSKAEIEKCTWSKIEADYSTLIIKKNTASEIKSAYSHVWINNSYGIYATSFYDDYKIKNCKKITLDANYTSTIIDTIEIDAKFNLNYGSFNIKRVSPEFESITINSNYTNVKTLIPDNACYTIDANLNYGKIDYSPKANVDKRMKNSQTSVTGAIGCSQPQSKVSIKGNYCDISLY